MKRAPSKGVRVGAVIRDVIIFFLLTFIGGFIVGASDPSRSPEQFRSALAQISVILGTVAFIISGSVTLHNRWAHLLCVALGAWLLNGFNIFWGHHLNQWLISAFPIFISMCLGGAISYVFTNESRPSAAAANTAYHTPPTPATVVQPQEPVHSDAKALLNLRLAGGEITISEYHDILNTITNAKKSTVKIDRVNVQSSSGARIPFREKHLYYIECPICNATLTATDDDGGMAQRCPTCLGDFQVPFLLRQR